MERYRPAFQQTPVVDPFPRAICEPSKDGDYVLYSDASQSAERIRELEHANDWQPISTAPKTGEHILVAEFNSERIGFGFCGGKKQSMMTVAHWWDNPGEEGWYASVDSAGEYPFPSTHWKPLNEL